jgi:hypothetical protein
MGTAHKFRSVSLAFAVGSTVLYWCAYIDHSRVIAERREALAASPMPIPLNGWKFNLRGVQPAPGHSGRSELADDKTPRLLMVVNDTCPGSAKAVPQWIEWIRRSSRLTYSAIVVSTSGTSYLSQISDELRARGVNSVTLQVSQAQDFTLSSGVSVTPALLGIDTRGRVRFVSGIFSQATSHALEKFLRAGEEVLATQ